MPDFMRAAVMAGFGQPLQLADVPRPRPGPGQLLIRLEASGVCHSDVHVWQGEMKAAAPPEPFILGHEGVGIVEEVGAGVAGWRPGMRAGVPWIHSTCGQCDECGGGHESFCQQQMAHGFNVPGTFSEYVVSEAAFTPHLPGGDAALLAPLMCAGLTAFGAIERARLSAGETCVIIGCGGLGLYAVQLAVRARARVIAIDRSETRLSLAKDHGAEIILDVDEALQSIAHVVINFAPSAAPWPMMLRLVRPLGRIVAAAMVAEPVALSQEWLAGTGVTITGTSVGTRAQMAALMALHQSRPLQGHVERIALAQASSALSALQAGTARARPCIVF